MIIKLNSGKELTLEEAKEVVDKFQELFGEREKEYIPYPVYPTPMTPMYPYYSPSTNPNPGYYEITCGGI